MSRYTSKKLNDKIKDNEKQISELNKKLADVQKSHQIEIKKLTNLVKQLEAQVNNLNKDNSDKKQ